MSLLTATQGSAERVWSLLRLLAVNPQGLSREEIVGWMSPRFTKDGVVVDDQTSAVRQTIEAALSIEMIRNEGRAYFMKTDQIDSIGQFADSVHDRLCTVSASEPDAVLFEGFAWVLVKSEKEGSFAWFSDGGRDGVAAEIQAGLPARNDDFKEDRINPTKMPYWRRWLGFLGLMAELPLGTGMAYPFVFPRLARELSRSDLPLDEEISAQSLLDLISQRMPYLDQGSIWRAAVGRSGGTAPSRVSRTLSVALRGLHDEGLIELRATGDQASPVLLAQDARHRFNAISHVVFKPELRNG